MAFQLHDSLTDTLIPLPERTPGETSVYVCGPTVYGHIHVGNARPPVVFDVLTRHLRAQGRNVTVVRNYTDVDDKIIQVAVASGEDPRVVTERYIAAYREEMAALLCTPPSAEPRVSEHIPDILGLIQALMDRGSAYATPDGDVYYDVATFPAYGKLSKRKLDARRSDLGRGRTGEGKRGEHDFALWKSARPTEPAGARWASPWGEGRPGWHIECSAMAHALLGDGFDLHAGGQDLKFPHHENEIAQSEPVYGTPMARAWMHNGFIEVDVLGGDYPDSVREWLPMLKEKDPDLAKISKSDPQRLSELRERMQSGGRSSPEDIALAAVLTRKVAVGAYFQLRKLRTRVDGEAVRLWILGTHYRSPLSFDVSGTASEPSFPALEQAEKRLEYFYDTRARVTARLASLEEGVGRSGATTAGTRYFADVRKAFDAALDDDLNTAGALDPLNRAYERTNKLCDEKKPDPGEIWVAGETLAHIAAVTGVADGDGADFFARVTARRIAARGLEVAAIDGLVAERVAARAARDFTRADALRAKLTGLGIEIRDDARGSTWRAL